MPQIARIAITRFEKPVRLGGTGGRSATGESSWRVGVSCSGTRSAGSATQGPGAADRDFPERWGLRYDGPRPPVDKTIPCRMVRCWCGDRCRPSDCLTRWTLPSAKLLLALRMVAAVHPAGNACCRAEFESALIRVPG